MKKKIKILLFICFITGTILSFLSVAGAADRPFRMCDGWPCYIDPSRGTDSTSTESVLNLYDSLVIPDVKGVPQPHIAESWNVSDDKKSWTFHLRTGIKFHDGTELTAEDVKFSMDRLTTIGEGYAYLFTERVLSTEVVDSRTVVFHLNKPCGPFLGMIVRLYILNKDLVMEHIEKPGPYGDMGDYGKEWLNANDAGSGPYMLKEYLPQESVTMAVNPNYWKPLDPNVPDEFAIFNIRDAVTIKTMLVNRELEVGYGGLTIEAVEAMDKIEGIDIAIFPTNSLLYYMMHTKKPPTDDVHFRKALAWGLDYKTIIEKIQPGVTYSVGPVPQICPGFDPTVLQYHQDFDKAREELKKSKYYNELDKYPVTVHWNANQPGQEKITLLFMSNMAELGIKVVSVKTPWMMIEEQSASIERSPNIMTVRVAAEYAEAGAFLMSKYTSETTKTYTQNEWLLDPNLDASIADAIETVDQEERFTKYSKLLHDITEDLCPSIFLYDKTSTIPYQSAYVDWPGGHGIGSAVASYEYYGPNIRIYKEKMLDLLK